MITHRILAAAAALALFAVTGLAAQAEELGRGQFAGASGHSASGHVTVVRTDKGVVLRLEKDFSFDGAPDPKLGFGRGGYKKESQFSPLNNNSGAEEYAIPGDIQAGNYDEVWIWCEKYNVPLGVAKLKR